MIQVENYTTKEQKHVKDFILDVWKKFGFYYMPEYDSDLDDPYKHYIESGGAFYVIKDNGKFVGTIGVINKGNGVAELKRFYVNMHYRGKGYGKLLYNKVEEFCKNNDFKKIEFETGKSFQQGHVFYKKQGFKIVRETTEDYYMEKNL